MAHDHNIQNKNHLEDGPLCTPCAVLRRTSMQGKLSETPLNSIDSKECRTGFAVHPPTPALAWTWLRKASMSMVHPPAVNVSVHITPAVLKMFFMSVSGMRKEGSAFVDALQHHAE